MRTDLKKVQAHSFEKGAGAQPPVRGEIPSRPKQKNRCKKRLRYPAKITAVLKLRARNNKNFSTENRSDENGMKKRPNPPRLKQQKSRRAGKPRGGVPLAGARAKQADQEICKMNTFR